MKSRNIFVALGLVSVFALTIACGDDGPEVVEPSGESQGYIDQIDGYETWFVFGDDTPTQSADHAGDFVVTYGNTEAETAITDEDYPFPQGTLIVKEQYPSADADSPSTLSVMAKQSDAEGDWYWLQTDTSGMVRTHGGDPIEGDVQMCAGCHAGAATDQVFLNAYGLD